MMWWDLYAANIMLCYRLVLNLHYAYLTALSCVHSAYNYATLCTVLTDIVKIISKINVFSRNLAENQPKVGQPNLSRKKKKKNSATGLYSRTAIVYTI
jgi:hypothetical protein